MTNASLWQAALIAVLVIGFWWGTVESVKAVFRRQEYILKQRRAAVEFAIANYDKLKDTKRDLLTRDSLLMGKFAFKQDEEREYVQILIDNLPKWGRQVPLIEGRNVQIFVLSRHDLERLRTHI